MELLVNQGTFEILTPRDKLIRQLLTIESAGRTCYKSQRDRITYASANKFIRMIMKRGHESVIEHSSLIVRFKNLSRGFTHEQVRHRLTGISQESTRYVDESDLHVVAPPHKDLSEKFPIGIPGYTVYSYLTLKDMFEIIESMYRALREGGWVCQDARQILPIGTVSEIVISANFREWRHIFRMRTGKAAHWEIRRVMCNLLEELQGIIPVIFEDFEEAGVDSNGLRFFRKGE